MDDVFGMPNTPEISDGVVVFLYSMVLFVMWDLSRFLLHMCMHRIPQLWAFHQVHHSAEILTPLTFYRIHPVESWLYSIRGALVTGTVAGLFYWVFRESINPYTLLGVPAFGKCSVYRHLGVDPGFKVSFPGFPPPPPPVASRPLTGLGV